MLKLVLDTNTIISGLLWKGNEFQLLQEVERGNAMLFLTPPILEEIKRVLHYPRLKSMITQSGLTPEQLLEKIMSLSHLVVGPLIPITICRDKKDNMFLECALLCNADYIISGDNDLLILKEYKNIRIVPTTNILKLI